MTDKKTKKERPSYDIEIVRRATVDADFNYYELKAIIDPAKIDGATAVRDIEKIVTFARELIASKADDPAFETAKKQTAPQRKAMREKKEIGKTEDIKIVDLKAGDKVNISVKLAKAIDPENDIKAFINKTDGSAGRRCKVLVADSNGKITLTLFDDQIDLVQELKENAWFTIENGYVKEYQGKLELVVGRYGKIECVFNG